MYPTAAQEVQQHVQQWQQELQQTPAGTRSVPNRRPSLPIISTDIGLSLLPGPARRWTQFEYSHDV